jgi:hypothetical protein
MRATANLPGVNAMMWNHDIGWHWLGSLAMVLFWALIILLALAPIKYLRSELKSPELRTPRDEDDVMQGGDDPATNAERR